MYHLKGMLIYESWEAEVWLLKKVALWTPGLLNSPAFWGRPWAFQERAFPRREAVCLGVQNKHLRAWERISAAIVDKPTTLRLQPVLESWCAFVSERGVKCLHSFMLLKEQGDMERGLLLLTWSRSSSCVPVSFDFLNLFKAMDIFAQRLISDEMHVVTKYFHF